MCLVQIKLEICAAYLATKGPIKYARLSTVNSLDCSSPSIRSISEDQKLSIFLRIHKASSFFKSFQWFSPLRWAQNLSKPLLHRATPLRQPPWVVLLLKKPPFLVSRMASAIENMKGHCLLTSSWSFLKLLLMTWISLVCVWFVNAVLALISKMRVWWSWSFYVLSTRPSRRWIERESRGLSVLRFLNAGLICKTRVWVSRLINFF